MAGAVCTGHRPWRKSLEQWTGNGYTVRLFSPFRLAGNGCWATACADSEPG